MTATHLPNATLLPFAALRVKSIQLALHIRECCFGLLSGLSRTQLTVCVFHRRETAPCVPTKVCPERAVPQVLVCPQFLAI